MGIWAYDDLHPLLYECSWVIKQGLGIVTCNTKDLIVIGLVCVFIEVFLTALYFRVTCCRHLQSLYCIHTSALCSWVPCWGTWEHKALVWVGCKLLRWGNNLPCGVYYSEFLDFFPVWGERSVNHGWLCTGEDVRQVCGHRPLLHQSTMGLAQEWTPPRYCAQGLSIATKLQNESQVQLYYSYTPIHTTSYNSCSSLLLLHALPHLHSTYLSFLHLHISLLQHICIYMYIYTNSNLYRSSTNLHLS
jgi:hypothetical protein